FLVRGVDGGELPPPVDGETSCLDHPSANLRVVRCQVFRVGEFLDLFGWYAVDLDERPPNLSVALLEPVAHSCNRFPRPVPGPGEEHIVPLHPFEARVDVDARRAEAVAYVDRAIHVRIGEGDEDLLLALQRVRLEEVPLVPCLQPFLFVLCHGAQPLTRDATVPSTDRTASSLRSRACP